MTMEFDYDKEGSLSEDDMLSLFERDPETACLIARDAAEELVTTLEEGLSDMTILEDYQKNIYVMAKVILYLSKDKKPVKMEVRH